MKGKVLLRLGDDDAMAAAIGLAVRVTADLERAHNQVFGGPLRALARAIHVVSRPDYSHLEASVRYSRALLQRILTDVSAAAMAYERLPAEFVRTCSCLKAAGVAGGHLIVLVRHYGKLDRKALGQISLVLRAYQQAWSTVHSERAMIAETWGPCRTREDLILPYFLKLTQDADFKLLHWEHIDPALATWLRELDIGRGGASAS